MRTPRPLRLLAAGAAVISALVAGEAGVRWLDGFTVRSLALRPLALRPLALRPPVTPVTPPSLVGLGASFLRHVGKVPLADGVDSKWSMLSPPEIARYPHRPDLLARIAQFPTDPIGALLVWNPDYLRTQLCMGNRVGSLGILDEFFVYEPTEPGPFPIFRHFPRTSPPSWFVVNSFGWRGPDLALQKPPRTIRLAFVGASTTVGVYGLPFSYPEFIGNWLNVWASAKGLPYTFEVINAARTGINSASIDAIVRQELLAVDPDLVVFYEGANDFSPGKTLKLPATFAARPAVTFRQRTEAENYSAVVRRVLMAFDMIMGGQGSEPEKPPYPEVWPAEVSESAPDVTHRPLPMDLQDVVANLDSMRASLTSIGSELALSSFIWMVYPGMQLDLRRNLTLYRYLNDTYWPATYAHMRRMVDFQNRVFSRYAERHQLAFFDVAAEFPRELDFFGDAIHMNQE